MSDTNHTPAWCLFLVRSRPFAVPLARVAEIVEVDALHRLPLSPPRLEGLCLLRRDVVPVVDVTAGALAETSPVGAKTMVLVLQSEHGPWGLRIDREGTSLEPAADAGAEGGGPRRGGRSHALLDLDATWREVRAAVLTTYEGIGGASAIRPATRPGDLA